MREINEIIIHCTGNTPNSRLTAVEIDKMHREERGWKKGIGYHYLVLPDGTVQAGRDLDVEGAHCKAKKKNVGTIAIAYVGGLKSKDECADTRTPQQRAAINWLVFHLSALFPIKRVTGHNDYANKACPCFDVKADLGIQDSWNVGRNSEYAVTYPLKTPMGGLAAQLKQQQPAKVVPINHV